MEVELSSAPELVVKRTATALGHLRDFSRLTTMSLVPAVEAGDEPAPVGERLHEVEIIRVDDFLDALRRVARGGSALDPVVVNALVSPQRTDTPLATLSVREREVIELVAQGLTNAAIADRLVVSERTIETHMRSIFLKLHIDDSAGGHRRVLAVLAYLTDRR